VITKTFPEGRPPHVDLQDKLVASIGEVRKVYYARRDSSHLPFPCYQVSARFDRNMSGGPVFDEDGLLCGIVCNGMEDRPAAEAVCNVIEDEAEAEPVSHAAALWPIFASGSIVEESGRQRSLLELAQARVIHVFARPLLDEFLANLRAHRAALPEPEPPGWLP
jgi:hypothetical protein